MIAIAGPNITVGGYAFGRPDALPSSAMKPLKIIGLVAAGLVALVLVAAVLVYLQGLGLSKPD